MELRQLRYFHAISKLKNFTKAAKQTCISQPSITASIQKLEEELNLKLFDRSQKQISLTSEGKIFFQRVDEVLNKIDTAISEIQDYAKLKKGRIKLGVTPMIGAYYFPQIFMGFKKAYPDISLNIVEEGTNIIKELLKEGAFDLGLGIICDDDDAYDTYPLFKKQVCVCVSESHPFCSKKRVTFDDIKNQSFIMFKEGFYLRELIFQHFKNNNFTPNITISTNQLETIKSFVSRNIGIAFLFENGIKMEKDLVSIPIENPLYITIGIISVKNKYLSKASQAFVDYIIQDLSIINK